MLYRGGKRKNSILDIHDQTAECDPFDLVTKPMSRPGSGVVEGDICSHIPQGIDQRWIEIIFSIIAVIINIISIFFRIELFLLRAFRRLQFLDDGDLIVTVGENLGAGPPNAARPVDIGDQEIAVVDDDVGAKFRQVFPKSIQGRFVHG